MRNGRNHNPGFTLLEIVLVMVVIMVIAGMVAPRLLGFAHGREGINLSEQIESVARAARAEAVAKSTTYVLNIDSRGKSFWVSREDGPQGATVASTVDSELGAHQGVPSDTVITYLSQDDSGNSSAAKEGNQIRFYADGRCDPGTIRVLTGDGAIEITCPTATESYRIRGGA